MKVLVLDIETTPNVAYVWKFFKEQVAPKQVICYSSILSWAAKWLGDPVYYYMDRSSLKEKDLLITLYSLLDKADVVIAHNGTKFDIPMVLARGLHYGLTPPSPFKIIDTYLISKKYFNFGSSSLENIAQFLNCAPKDDHKNFPGFLLWIECLKGNPKAFEELCVYNQQDVTTLEQIYFKLRPYIPNHPNYSLYENKVVCPKCGSIHYQKRGYYYSNNLKYQRYFCNDCGGWFRERYTSLDKNQKKQIITNAI